MTRERHFRFLASMAESYFSRRALRTACMVSGELEVGFRISLILPAIAATLQSRLLACRLPLSMRCLISAFRSGLRQLHFTHTLLLCRFARLKV